MSAPFSWEADIYDAAGCPVYLHPFDGRVAIRVAASPEETGLPDAAHAALVENRVAWFFLDPDVALVLLANVLLVLKTRAPWRALLSRYWPHDNGASPEIIGRRIAILQRRIERTQVTRRYRALLLSTTSLMLGALLLGILAARAVEALAFSPLVAGAATGAASRMFFRSQAPRLGLRHPILSAATLGPIPIFSLARAMEMLPVESLALAASSVGLLAWQMALYVDTPKPSRALPSPPTCPHSHYSKARQPSDEPNCEFVEGSRYLDLETTWRRQEAIARATPEPVFPYGGFLWRLSELAHHGLIVGVTGSGKTLLLSGIHRAVAKHLLSVWYDHRRTDYPRIVGSLPGGEEEVALLYPLDRRGKAWFIARDVADAVSSRALAVWLTQDVEREGFWKFIGTEGVDVIFQGFNELKPGQWTLLDSTRIATPKLLPRFLEQTTAGQRFLESILTSESRVGDRPGDVIATIAALLSRLTTAAIAAEELHQAGRTFSIRDWARGATPERAIVFSGHPLYGDALALYNQAIMSQIARALLAQPGKYAVPRALVVIDELQTAPEFDVFELLTNGRDKGVTVWMATQDLEGLVERYGSREAINSLVGAVRHQAFLRSACDVTAEKASALAGLITYVRHQVSRQWSRGTSVAHSVGAGGASSSSTKQESTGGSSTPGYHTEKLLPAHVPLNMPLPTPANGLVRYFRREDEQWFPSIHPRWLEEHLAVEAPVAAEIPVDVGRLTYVPWSERDLDRLIRGTNEDVADDPFGDL